MTADEVIRFWFEELQPGDHWAKNPQLDNEIAARFGELWAAAARAELFAWRTAPEGRLAEILVLDQFSRNIWRNHPNAFASDPLAAVLTQEMVSAGLAAELPARQQAFVYMPLMHSESRLLHQEALRLFSQPGLESNLRFEERHKAIIDRFGRYPHRNAILGRESTEEELEFLRQPGSSF